MNIFAAHNKSGKTVVDLIKLRRSRRNFTDAPIEEKKQDRLAGFMAELKSCPFGSKTRFQLVELKFEGKGRVPGTYGVIKGAKTFITGVVEENPHGFIDYGYQMEQIILLATGLGLATCWMGGTFKRSVFADKMKLNPGEMPPAVSPVGHASGESSVIDSVFRFGAKSSTRKPWTEMFYQDDFETPLDEKTAGGYAVPLEMVRLAPSASNRQPWRIVKNRGGFHLFLQRTKSYDKLTKDVDLQQLDMGIAMCHFELAALELGIAGKWESMDAGVIITPERTEYVVSWKV
jgi:nitroreductase